MFNAEETDTKKIISRLVLQKLLQHDVCKFLDKQRYEDLSKVFLSNEPDKDLRFDFKTSTSNDKYYSAVADLTIRWMTDELEKQDPEGNVWKVYNLRLSTGISARWTMTMAELVDRADCIKSLSSFVEEINELAGQPIQIKILTNGERIARDEKVKYNKICSDIIEIIKWKKSELRRGLRSGGKSRSIRREEFANIPPGKYEFQVNDGSSRAPRYKKYSVTIPENPVYLVVIKRIE